MSAHGTAPAHSTLRIWLEPGYDHGRWGALMLDWPGCFCWGPTREGAIARGWSQVMGFARIASDGVLIGYVAGVVVHPHWQGRALGTRVVERLLEGLRRGALHSRGAQ